MLVVTSNTVKSTPAILFYKGVNTKDGIRFEKGVGLFTAKDGALSLPGNSLYPLICDYNEDGILDIVLGIRISHYENENLFALDNIHKINELNKQKIYPINKGYVVVLFGKGHYK